MERSDYFRELAEGPLYSFDAADWSSSFSAIPRATAGVYTIWEAVNLVYVGMSGRDDSKVAQAKENSELYGLAKRLKAHQSGARSGDQFCVYVADRLVIRSLTREQIELISDGELSLDHLTRDYIHQNLKFRFVSTESADESRSIENEIKDGALGQSPDLNPN